jgi:hypothetical protein
VKPPGNRVNQSNYYTIKEKKEMKVGSIIGTVLLALAFMLAASPALAQIEIGYFNDFQKSLDKFLPGSSLDSCVTKDTLKLNFEKMAAKMGLPSKYNGYAELTRDCDNPVWMMTYLTSSRQITKGWARRGRSTR